MSWEDLIAPVHQIRKQNNQYESFNSSGRVSEDQIGSTEGIRIELRGEEEIESNS